MWSKVSLTLLAAYAGWLLSLSFTSVSWSSPASHPLSVVVTVEATSDQGQVSLSSRRSAPEAWSLGTGGREAMRAAVGANWRALAPTYLPQYVIVLGSSIEI